MDERPSYCSIIRTRWVFRNEVNQDGKIVRNKARLVSHRYNQEEDIINKAFAHVAHLESIHICMIFLHI